MSIRQLLRKPFESKVSAPEVDLIGKRAIVTGSSAGSLGYATALILARWGADVFVSTRKDTAAVVSSLQAELKAENIQANIAGMELDLSVSDSVNRFSEWYLRDHGERLDILVNNAGVHLDLMSKWKEPKLTADGLEIHWRTNYLGSTHLTHNLLPLLCATGNAHGEARVVNVVSQLHSRGRNQGLFDSDVPYNSWRAYGLSKLGMIHHAYELHRRYGASENVKAFALHPGGPSGTSTNVAGKGLEEAPVINALRKLGTPLEYMFMATAEEGAQTQVYCATSPDAESGNYYQNCEIFAATEDTQDETVAARLWDETATWLGEVANGK